MTGETDQPCPRCGAALPHDTRVCQMAPGSVDRHGSEAPRDPLDARATARNAVRLGVGCLVLLAALALVLWLLA